MDGFGVDLIFCIGLYMWPVACVHNRRVNKAWNEALSWRIRNIAQSPAKFIDAYEYAICMNDALASFVIRYAFDDHLLKSIYIAVFNDLIRKSSISTCLRTKLQTMYPEVDYVSMPYHVMTGKWDALRTLVVDNLLVGEAHHVLKRLRWHSINTLHMSCTDKVTRAGIAKLRLSRFCNLRALRLFVDTDTPVALLRSLFNIGPGNRIHSSLEHVYIYNRSENRTHMEYMAPVALLMCNVPYCELENCIWVCGPSCAVAMQFADLANQCRAHVPASWWMNVDIRDLAGNEVLRLS